ncbi:phosphate ABC transporter ATP-binding protein [Pyrofollis japonicus]|uniref:phosphate ABC transporter ATP-binding protein n=1 Tax=Pyrofollis japonicus TaxID=3060460 RepID=UPI00295B7F76|nr:phosphate ABC transporter ATP-binding protein [Pyrofollis japonicus]BEP17180.1 phosphate ABC transporter ATP-binding protein [Pyrofollis japonicus]
MSTGEAVRTEKLNVWIRGKHILKNIDFRAVASAITVIMGPSGSGKSTLLRSINRLIELFPDVKVEGKVYVLGRDVYREDPYRIRRYITMVSQTPNPFPHMSIYDNVAIGPKLHKIAKTKEELDRIVRWALEKAMLWDEVKDRLHDPPTRLSGGQQQRLCLARALALKPKILLLDEPTANIDPVNARKIEEAIKMLVRDEGLTVIMVTHTPAQAVRVADFIAFIYNGELIEYGPAREIALNPRHRLTELYLRGEIG